MSDHPEQSVKIPAGTTVPKPRYPEEGERWSTFKKYGGRRKKSIVRRAILVERQDWEWALKQVGGASKWINMMLHFARRRDEQEFQRQQIIKLRNEVLRLEAKLRAHDIEPLDEVPNANEKG